MHLLRANGAKALQKAQAEWEFCQEHGIRPIAITASDYPQRLKDCPDAPAVLFYRGSAEWNVPHVLSVVGTRRISPYGKDLCRMFCQELARLFPDTLVVSGLAYGVDVHVHKACLEQQLPTIGVFGAWTGPDLSCRSSQHRLRNVEKWRSAHGAPTRCAPLCG